MPDPTDTQPLRADRCVPLDRLEPRHGGIVRRIEAQDDDMERLMAMGVCAGRTVELIQRGDPLILKVFGSRIGVSARLAGRVIVEPCGMSVCPTTPAPEPRP